MLDSATKKARAAYKANRNPEKILAHVLPDCIKANSHVYHMTEDRRGFPGIILKDRTPTEETLRPGYGFFTVNGYSY